MAGKQGKTSGKTNKNETSMVPSPGLALMVGGTVNPTAELIAAVAQGEPPCPVVTPQKAPPPASPEDERMFYIVNKETHEYMKQESKEIAMATFELMQKLAPETAEKLVVQDFENAESMTAFIDALITMGGKKPACNPMSSSAVNPAVGLTPLTLVAMRAGAKSPPAKRPKLGFASTNERAATMDATMKRYQEALKNSNSKLDVWHLKLEGASFDAWGFSLKENDDFYWSWKPLVLEKAIMKEQEVRLFEKEGTTMDEMLFYVRAANIRETPCGPNIPSAFTLKSGKKMDRMLLFGLIPSPSTEADVKATMTQFAQQCKNSKIQLAYGIAMENIMKAESIKKDVQEGGPLWEKMASAANNIVYTKLDCLSQVLCDHTIDEIIRLCYGYGGGISPSMWERKVFKLAFGESKSGESA
jgi:hypothetical protein